MLDWEEEREAGVGAGQARSSHSCLHISVVTGLSVFRNLHQALSWTDTNNTVQYRGVSCVGTP